MKMRIRLWSVLLALALIVLPLSASAEAEEEPTEAAAYYEYVSLIDGNRVDYCGALYSDSMLLADAGGGAPPIW